VKKYTKFLPFLLLGLCLVLNSCSSDTIDQNDLTIGTDAIEMEQKSNGYLYVYSSDEVDIAALAESKGIDANGRKSVLRLELHIDFEMPDDYLNHGMESSGINFIEENISNINGALKFYENNKLVRLEVIDEGVITAT
jgi:hypothetical protein